MINKRARSRRGRTHHLFRRMQKANCELCGEGIRVPFIPVGKKPLYCEKCLEKMKKEWQQKKGLEGREKEPRY
jgi:CxxC-x17-CxxC domain-containing protein